MMRRMEEFPSTIAAQSDNGAVNEKPVFRGNSSTPMMEGPSTWSGYNLYGATVKEEPMDDTRNDSGVTSESDCPSGSPESDRSGISHPTTSPLPNSMYAYPIKAESQFPWYGSQSLQNSPTARPGPSSPENQPENSTDARSLKNDDSSNGFDDESIRNPKVNSHGKMKINKCKQCNFFSYTKLDFWKHSRVHIKSDKCLNCPHCPFVTEYKHHLEYHILNHSGAKPFKCSECDYTCVNKSMLNSHLKSHSKVYQYRCANCNYETKYCHSLKLHLRKYGHSPDIVLFPDGTPNPYPVIDVYGTRRGPKVKKLESKKPMPATAAVAPVQAPTQQQNLMNNSAPMLNNPASILNTPAAILNNPASILNTPASILNNPTSMLPFNLLPFAAGFAPSVHPVHPEVVMNFLKEHFQQLRNPIQAYPEVVMNFLKEHFQQLSNPNQAVDKPAPVPEPSEPEALDLTQKSPGNSVNGESDNEYEMTTAFSNVEVVVNQPEVRNEDENTASQTISESSNETYCKHCKTNYDCEMIYRLHIGYHGFNNPFTCNMCGLECHERTNFNMHLYQCGSGHK